MAKTPEQQAREEIDAALVAAGWLLQDAAEANLFAGRGIAVREFPLKSGHGHADYALFVDGKACGIVEAKKARGPAHRRRGPGREVLEGPRDAPAPSGRSRS